MEKAEYKISVKSQHKVKQGSKKIGNKKIKQKTNNLKSKMRL